MAGRLAGEAEERDELLVRPMVRVAASAARTVDGGVPACASRSRRSVSALPDRTRGRLDAVATASRGLHRRRVGRSAAGGARPRTQAVVAAAVALALAGTGCGGAGSGRRREPPEPALRIWTPGIVWWDDSRRTFPLEVENGTGRPVQVEAPGPRRTRVVLFAGPEQDRVCGHDADASPPPGDPVSLAPGEGRAVRVDLEAACGRLPPGEYRYEVGYEAPAVGPGPSVRLRTVHGHVVVRRGGAQDLDRGSLGSQRGAEDGAGARFHGLSR